MDKIYRGGLTREQFLFYEIRVISKMIYQGKDEKEIIGNIISDNLFQLPTEKSIKSIARGCYKRLKEAGTDRLIGIIANEPVEVAKQASLYLLMRYNKLVWDFMVDVIGEKYMNQDFSFEKKDVIIFLDKLQQENEEIAQWTESTMKKIKTVLVKCLSETGYLNSINDKTLNAVYLYDEVLESIKENGETYILPAFNYFE